MALLAEVKAENKSRGAASGQGASVLSGFASLGVNA